MNMQGLHEQIGPMMRFTDKVDDRLPERLGLLVLAQLEYNRRYAAQKPAFILIWVAVFLPRMVFAMTLNELCTNTTKFGALSVPSGQVAIAWRIDEEKNRLLFSWTESGGPVVYAPIRRSFGTRLIQSLGQQLKGEVQLNYSPAGFACTLDAPMSSLQTAA